MKSVAVVLSGIAIALLTAGSAQAEEIAKKTVAVPAAIDPTVQSLWSGLYLGVHAGVGGGREKYPIAIDEQLPPDSVTGSGDVHMDAAGRLFGAQIGYNYVFPNRVLLGLESDISWSNVTDRVGGMDIISFGAIGSQLDYFGTLRGRLGYVVADPWLVYATAGLAYGSIKTSYWFGSSATESSQRAFRTGWVIGVGTAYAITPNLSLRADYLHASLNSIDLASYSQISGPNTYTASLRLKPVYDMVRVGLDYRFNGTAPATTFAPPAFAPPDHFSWTGFHVGATGGYVAARDTYPIDVTGVPFSSTGRLNGSGALLGLEAGYDYQFDNRIVIGAEADLSIANVPGKLGVNVSATGTFGGTPTTQSESFVLGSSLRYLGTLRARAGYAITDPWLVYATGGLAYGLVESAAGYALSDSSGPTSVSARISGPSLHGGWVLGTGTEFALTQNVTLRAEYDHIELSRQKLLTFTAGTEFTLSHQPTYDFVRLGVNYKF